MMGFGDICLDVAVHAAREAGSIHKSFIRNGFDTTSKEGPHNKVTEADIQSERRIKEIIRSTFPDHGCIGEEEGTEKHIETEYTWIIDPLDGTNNFYKGFPHHCVSIAVVDSQQVLCGVIYDPIRNELFSAINGRGAFMNQKPICVSQTPDLKEALVLTGFHYGRGKETRETLRYIEDLMSMGILGIRRTGSAALDLAYLACGRGDAFWEYKLSPWDIAAGILIVREAGGIATDREGHPLYPSTSFIIAANARIHPILLEILRKPPICASE